MKFLKQLRFSVIFIFLAGFACAQENKEIFFWHGDKNKKTISLTFDDGPSRSTGRLLELLKRKNVKATFFVLGINAKTFPAALKQIDSEGHEIGNHTYNHINFAKYKNDDYKQKLIFELDKTKKLLKEITGKDIFVVRMTHGYTRDWVKEAAVETGSVLVNWSCGCDWLNLSLEEMAQKYLKAIEPGAILLFHDSNAKIDLRLKVVESVIDAALSQGYQFVTIKQMFNLTENTR